MARTKVDNKLNVVIGTKAQVEADSTIPDNSIVIVTDEELTPSDIPQLAPSKITQDANNRFVTDTEKSTWNSKQATLVSGTNVKTINADSILGSGNIELQQPLTNVTTAEIVTGTATTQKTVTAKVVHDAIMQIMFDSLGGES